MNGPLGISKQSRVVHFRQKSESYGCSGQFPCYWPCWIQWRQNFSNQIIFRRCEKSSKIEKLPKISTICAQVQYGPKWLSNVKSLPTGCPVDMKYMNIIHTKNKKNLATFRGRKKSSDFAIFAIFRGYQPILANYLICFRNRLSTCILI